MLLLQLAQELDDLRLHREVEGGGGLVEQDELGLERDGPGDGDALALAAGELVREALQDVVGHAGVDQRGLDAVDAVLGAGADVVDDQALLEEAAHAEAGVQRGEGVLEDDLHPRAERAERLAVEAVDARRRRR